MPHGCVLMLAALSAKEQRGRPTAERYRGPVDRSRSRRDRRAIPNCRECLPPWRSRQLRKPEVRPNSPRYTAQPSVPPPPGLVTMRWIAPSAKDTATATLEKRLWAAADELRANSGLTSAQYSVPVLGLIFLRFEDAKFAARRAELESAAAGRRGSRVDDPGSYHATGVLFLPPASRFKELLEYPEGGRGGRTLGHAVDEAMRAIECENPQLSGVLPKTYQVFNARLLKELLKTFSTIPVDLEGDSFGKTYEYFLAEFELTEGQGGGDC